MQLKEQSENMRYLEEAQDSIRMIRRKYLKYKDAEVVYSLTHRKLLEMADEAGAIFRIDGTVLINRDIFDEYLEQFHQKPCTYSAYTKRKELEKVGKESE